MFVSEGLHSAGAHSHSHHPLFRHKKRKLIYSLAKSIYNFELWPVLPLPQNTL
jgi:hypothetical protein